jgi:hypothetical protein
MGVCFFAGCEAERLKLKVLNLERESFALKMQLEELTRQMAVNIEEGRLSSSSVAKSSDMRKRGVGFATIAEQELMFSSSIGNQVLWTNSTVVSSD